MKNSYINIHLYIPDEFQELVYANIYDLEFSGIEEKFDEIIITFETPKFTPKFKEELLERIGAAYSGFALIKEENIEDKNWNEEWEKNVPVIEINERIAITPSWKSDNVKQALKILINPKMSFGTGDHPTTRLSCRLLEKNLSEGSFWIDVGTGTGVLAILASKLGADRVIAFDNNIWSIENAEENFILNDVQDKIELLENDIDTYIIPNCDGIVANIFLHLAKQAFPKFRDALKFTNGHLILSGILSYDDEIILESAKKYGFELIELLHEEEWSGYHFKYNQIS